MEGRKQRGRGEEGRMGGLVAGWLRDDCRDRSTSSTVSIKVFLQQECQEFLSKSFFNDDLPDYVEN